jgi:biopolymer transport protein TolQ
MTLVAGGISEALVSTAAGLAVAIPASMIYNYFTFHLERLQRLSRGA